MNIPISRHWLKTAPIFVLFYLLGAFIAFHDVVLSGFQIILGDELDARLIIHIQEHWLQVLAGRVDWLDLGMFFPVDNSLGYSDAFFLFAIGHGFFRLLGFGIYEAAIANCFLLAAIGYAGMYLILRREAGMPRVLACWGGSLFICASPIMVNAMMSHPQMLNVWLLPYPVMLIGTLLRRRGAPWRRVVIPALLLGLTLSALFFTTFYTSWFFVLYTGFMIVIVILVGLFSMSFKRAPSESIKIEASFRHGALKNRLENALDYRFSILLFALAFFASLTPFFMTYVPVLHESGGWGFSSVKSNLPVFADFLNPSIWNLMWSGVWAHVLGYGEFHAERQLGLPLLTFCLFFVSGGLLYRRRREQLVPTEVQSAPLFSPCALWAAFIAVLVCWLLLLRVEGISLWWIIFETVPGASAIRSPFRFNAMLVLPIIVIIGWGIHTLWQVASRSSSWNEWLLKCALVGAAGFALAEQWNGGRDVGETAFDISRVEKRIARIPPPPAGTEVFYAIPYASQSWANDLRSALDAWAIGQKHGLKTVNGFSGVIPQGFELFRHNREGDPQDIESEVFRWLALKNYTGPLAKLNLETAEWSAAPDPADLETPYPLGTRIYPGTDTRDTASPAFEDFVGRGWSPVEPWGVWAEGSPATLRLRLQQVPTQGLVLTACLGAYLPPSLSRQRFTLKANDTVIADFVVDPETYEREFSFSIEAARIGSSGLLQLEFHSYDSVSPQTAQGMSDTRSLGLSLIWFMLNPAPQATEG